jgi:hypothetical protein
MRITQSPNKKRAISEGLQTAPPPSTAAWVTFAQEQIAWDERLCAHQPGIYLTYTHSVRYAPVAPPRATGLGPAALLGAQWVASVQGALCTCPCSAGGDTAASRLRGCHAHKSYESYDRGASPAVETSCNGHVAFQRGGRRWFSAKAVVTTSSGGAVQTAADSRGGKNQGRFTL